MLYLTGAPTLIRYKRNNTESSVIGIKPKSPESTKLRAGLAVLSVQWEKFMNI